MVDNTIVDLHAHSQFCTRDGSAEPIARFKQALSEALSQHWYSLKALYDSLAAVHPDAAEKISYQDLRSFMKKCRKKHYPQCPHTIDEFVQQLTNPEHARNLEYESGRFEVVLVTDDNGSKHIMLYDANFIREEMSEVTRLFIDATFKSRPRLEGIYQLLTIVGIKLNHGFPFIWVLMSTKTQVAYEAILRYVREEILQANRIKLAMSDFERGLRNAITSVFTSAHSTGCNTHYDRAIFQKVKTLGLRGFVRDNAEGNAFIKKVLALAYLPPNLIEGQYHSLENNLSTAVKARLNEFRRYYQRYWLRTVTPVGFSVYGLGQRTNNVIESYHNQLGHKMGNRPGPWDFVGKLLKLQSNVQADIRRLKSNCRISRHARYTTVFKQKNIFKAWRELHRREITASEFLEKAASLKGNVDDLIAQETGAREGNEFELQEPPVAVPLEQDPDYDPTLFEDNRPEWLMDNVERPPTVPENNFDESYSDDTSSDDEPVDGNPIEVEVQLYEHPVEVVQARLHEHPIEVDDEVVWMDEEVQRAPSPNNDEANLPESLEISDHERLTPTLNNNVGPSRNRQRRRKKKKNQQAAPAEETAERNKKRNRKRKELRQKAQARLRAQATENPLPAVENRMATEAERGSCRICLLQRATHTYVPCGHYCCCALCADRVWETEDEEHRCPLCRTTCTAPPIRIWFG